MENNWLVGVDIGGTTIKMAFIDFNGEIICKWEIPTNIAEQGFSIPADIAKAISQQLINLGEGKERLAGIGIGAPGPVNANDGSLSVAINLGWRDFPLKSVLEKEIGLPVVVENDANMAALGEMWKGAGEGAKNLVCVTLGTGVGGGVIVNGEIVPGINGAAGEIGHVTSVTADGTPCNCGKTGCLETVASATGIVRLALKEMKENPTPSMLKAAYAENGSITSKLVFEAAKENDPIAKKVVDEVTFHLGIALANLANVLNPEKIVIGGGVSKADEILLTPLRKYFKHFAFPRAAEGIEINIATLGNDAGVIGGAWLIKKNLMQIDRLRSNCE